MIADKYQRSLMTAVWGLLLVFLNACAATNSSQDVKTVNGSRSNSDLPAATTGQANDQGTNVSEASPFKSGLELHGIKFRIESPNSHVGNTVTVVPSGLEVSNDPFTSPVLGEVVDAQIGDLNVDRSPEVYIFVRERGGIGKVSVVAYATNARKSMSEFVLPEPDTGTKEYSGYAGGDKFEVVENVLARQFPLFESTNGSVSKTGKTRVIQYKIRPGEATWQFYVHRFDEF